MEMLMKRDIFVGIVTATFFGSFAWMATTLISVDKRTEITVVKVNANYEMIKPLWEDFIKRSAKYEIQNESK